MDRVQRHPQEVAAYTTWRVRESQEEVMTGMRFKRLFPGKHRRNHSVGKEEKYGLWHEIVGPMGTISNFV